MMATDILVEVNGTIFQKDQASVFQTAPGLKNSINIVPTFAKCTALSPEKSMCV